MPPVWPDEAYLADVALNIQRTGRVGTDIWGDTVIGIRDSFYYYPPVYIYTLAYWFKLVGFSIYSQRILSVIFGAILLVIFYLYSKSLLPELSEPKKKIVLMVTMFCLVIDNVFLKAVRIGRTEVMILIFITLSMYMLQQVQNINKNRWIFYGLIGFLLGLAFLTHFLSIVFISLVLVNLMLSAQTKNLRRDYLLLVILFSSPIILWVITVLPNYQTFLNQLSLQSNFRVLMSPYVEGVFKHAVLEERIIYYIYFVLSLAFLLLTFLNKSKQYLILLTAIVLSWAVCFFGELEWYSIYPVFFLYICISILVSHLITNRKQPPVLLWLGGLTVFLTACLLILNFGIYGKFHRFNTQNPNHYFKFSEQVKEIIPPQKTVYLSTTPDLFFTLYGRNSLSEFPALVPKTKEYIKQLDNSDYLLINFRLDRRFVGNLLDKYIELNQLREFSVEGSGSYQAKIIELRPKKDRLTP